MDKEYRRPSVPGGPPAGRLSEGVRTLLGDPKKAIIKLSLPVIAAISIQTIYNLVDAIWVSGLGADALAAVGFFFPFYFMSLAIGLGLGIGGGSAISRRIGAKDRAGAGSVATHTLVLMAILATVVAIPLFTFAEPIFVSVGAGRTTGLVVSYARIMFGGTFIVFFPSVASAILRAEGDVKRAMYAMAFGSVLNIALDPIFIYTLGMGVAGAAWATIISMSSTSLILINWLFLRKDTYVTFTFRGFRFDKVILRDILSVGVPASVMFLAMSFTLFIMNVIIVNVGGTDGVAVFSTGWRVVTIATLPVIGIGTAVVSVTGAAYGSRDYEKLKTAYMYAIRLGVMIEVPAAVATYLLAPYIAGAFTWAENSARIADDLVLFLSIAALTYPAVAFGPASSSMFQGTGKGVNALIVTVIRTVLLTPPLALLFAYLMGLGLPGVWWGIVVANLIGASLAFVWALLYIRGLKSSLAMSAEMEEAPARGA